MFENRRDAALKLAARLDEYKGQNPLVLGHSTRGGAHGPAHRRASWSGEVDVVLVRKLRAPGNPEFAIGAVEESGWAFIAPHCAASTGADDGATSRRRRRRSSR